jgi:hypothetical protein
MTRFKQFLAHASSIRRGVLSVAAACLCLAVTARADVIPVAPADFMGSRTESSGFVVTIGDWVTDGEDFTFSWDITFDGMTGLYTYVYTVDGFGPPDISHLSVAASDGRPSTVIFTEDNVKPGSDPVTVGDLNDGMFGAPSDLYGIKFDFGDGPPQSYTLVTDRAPIYGSFFAKAGADSGAYNFGWDFWGDFLADTSIPGFIFDKNEWVAVPDTRAQVIPEPSSIVLLGLGGLGLLGFARARRPKAGV